MLKPGKEVDISLKFTMMLEVIDKSWGLVLSPTLTPIFRNTIASFNE